MLWQFKNTQKDYVLRTLKMEMYNYNNLYWVLKHVQVRKCVFHAYVVVDIRVTKVHTLFGKSLLFRRWKGTILHSRWFSLSRRIGPNVVLKGSHHKHSGIKTEGNWLIMLSIFKISVMLQFHLCRYPQFLVVRRTILHVRCKLNVIVYCVEN